MQQYKQDFIDFLLESGALKMGSEFKLKSSRSSPYFINVGEFNDGKAISKLGEAYASAIQQHFDPNKIDILFGPSYKGIPLAVTTAIALAESGHNIGYAFDRKEVKDYGEVTDWADLQKACIVGKTINDNARIILLDDVFTTGTTKYEIINLLNKIACNIQYRAFIIAVNRQEVGVDGKDAIATFSQETSIPVISIITISEIYEYLMKKSKLNQKEVEKISNYLRVYGTSDAKTNLKKVMPHKIIDQERSIIPACDVDTLEKLEEIVRNTAELNGIGGYKIGFELGLGYGLKTVVETIRKYTNKPIIYDHQKAGTDIPDTGKNFARVCKEAGVNAVIFFPIAGPETEKAWIYQALNQDLEVIIGGMMTHPAFLRSEGGFINDESALEIYQIAARAGVNNFVVPGNKLQLITKIRETIENEGIIPIFYFPGFMAQSGKIEEVAKVAGDRWHAIVGRGIYEAADIKKAAEEYTSRLNYTR